MRFGVLDGDGEEGGGTIWLLRGDMKSNGVDGLVDLRSEAPCGCSSGVVWEAFDLLPGKPQAFFPLMRLRGLVIFFNF